MTMNSYSIGPTHTYVLLLVDDNCDNFCLLRQVLRDFYL